MSVLLYMDRIGSVLSYIALIYLKLYQNEYSHPISHYATGSIPISTHNSSDIIADRDLENSSNFNFGPILKYLKIVDPVYSRLFELSGWAGLHIQSGVTSKFRVRTQTSTTPVTFQWGRSSLGSIRTHIHIPPKSKNQKCPCFWTRRGSNPGIYFQVDSIASCWLGYHSQDPIGVMTAPGIPLARPYRSDDRSRDQNPKINKTYTKSNGK